jgi:hypothetical protein
MGGGGRQDGHNAEHCGGVDLEREVDIIMAVKQNSFLETLIAYLCIYLGVVRTWADLR